MEDVSTGVLEQIKNIQEVKIKPKWYDVSRYANVKIKNMKIYYPVCQTYSPTRV